jgi:hypothetical protein
MKRCVTLVERDVGGACSSVGLGRTKNQEPRTPNIHANMLGIRSRCVRDAPSMGHSKGKDNVKARKARRVKDERLANAKAAKAPAAVQPA